MLPLIPLDKANHACYGGMLACLGSMHSIAVGAALCVFFAIAKEVRDRVSGKGTPDVLDAVATMLGGVVVLDRLVAWRLA